MNYGIDAPKTPSLLLKKTGFLKKSALLVSSCLLAFSAQTATASQLSDLKAGSYGSKLQMDGVDLTTDPNAAKIDIEYLGVGGYLITWGEEQIMFAPSYSNPDPISLLVDMKVKESSINRLIPDVSDVDMILVGHSHYDHLLDIPYIMQNKAPNAKLYGSKTMSHLLASVVDPQDMVVMNDPSNDFSGTGSEAGTWVYNDNSTVRIMAIKSNHAPNATLFRGVIVGAGGENLIADFPILFEISKGKLDADLSAVPKSAFLWKEGQSFAYVVDFLNADGSVAYRLHYEDAASDPDQGFIPQSILSEKSVDLAILTVANFNEIKIPWDVNTDPDLTDAQKNLYLYPQGVINNLNASHYILGHWENFFANNEVYSQHWFWKLLGLNGKNILPLSIIALTNVTTFLDRLESVTDSDYTLPKPGAKMVFPANN